MRILASPAFKNRDSNPYNAALYTALEARGVAVREFTKKRVLLDGWDVVHVHWPDTPLHCRSVGTACVLTAFHIFRLLLARIRGAKIVWTVHNLRSHNPAFPRIERWLWKLFVPLVDASIHLSGSGLELALEKFPLLASTPHFVIPHGHYRDCYENNRDRETARGELGIDSAAPVVAFVGQIKSYKNVTTLAHAFLDGIASLATLLIAGKSGDAAIESELRSLAEKCPQMICRFGLIPENEMQFHLNACDLAVFPYRDILNSGSAILALSFDRPVLVPARGAMAELRDLAGAEWVMTYDGELTGEVLREALRWATETPRPARCDLAALDWSAIADQTFAAYRAVTRGEPVAQNLQSEALA